MDTEESLQVIIETLDSVRGQLILLRDQIALVNVNEKMQLIIAREEVEDTLSRLRNLLPPKT